MGWFPGWEWLSQPGISGRATTKGFDMAWDFQAQGTTAELDIEMASPPVAPTDPVEQDMRAAVFTMVQRLYDTTAGEVPNTALQNPLDLKIHGSATEKGWRLTMTMQVIRQAPNNQISTASPPYPTLGGATTGP